MQNFDGHPLHYTQSLKIGNRGKTFFVRAQKGGAPPLVHNRRGLICHI
jgi:hypothetical protein